MNTAPSRWLPIAAVLSFAFVSACSSGSSGPAGQADARGAGGSSSSGGSSTGAGGSDGGGSGDSGAGGGGGGGGDSAGGGGGGGSTSSSGGSSGGNPDAGSTGGGGSGGRVDGGPAGSSGSGGGGMSSSGGMVGIPDGGGPMPLVYGTENTGADCPKPAIPAFGALPSVANLPDPFLMTSGTRIASRADWRCRRAEIAAQIQALGTGPKGAPPASETATFSNGKLTVVVTQGPASITLTSTITTPGGSGPFPLIIGMNTPTGSLPAGIFANVAQMAFTDSQLVANDFSVTRGAGTYFTMYPDTNTGAMIEWAWGVSRLIDGLYMTASQNHIDLDHIGVTGCSFQGKMALYAGAFDERIALTIPEESGGGGEAAWRVSATMTGTEDLEHAQGTAWYAANLLQFKNADAPKLPYDQHELAAMVAPRALLTIGNPDIDYLATQSGYVSMKAATEVYKALGVPDRIGFSQVGGHAHCAFPTSQTADVQAFVDKFLLGKTSTNTRIAKSPYSTDLTRWVTWSTPQLQ